MNRATRITLIGFGIVLGMVLWKGVAGASDAMARIRQQYENCVYAAVGEQWKAKPKIAPNTAAETAFLSCTTEEQAIYSRLDLVGIDLAQAQASVVGVKLRLKGKIREIMGDPAAYLKRNQ